MLTTIAVLQIDYWYEPQYVIPLAGMIFSNAMNTVSLAAERFEADSPALEQLYKCTQQCIYSITNPTHQYIFRCRFGGIARDDDGANFVRCFTLGSGQISNCNYECAVWVFRHLSSTIFVIAKTYFQ